MQVCLEAEHIFVGSLARGPFCRYFSYEPAEGECYLYETCKKREPKEGYDLYALGTSTARLQYIWDDSGCSAKTGLQTLGKMLASNKIHAVIGPGCSTACKVTSYLSSAQNITQISFGVYVCTNVACS